MKKPILSLSIDDSKGQFEINQHFSDFSIDDLSSIIGFLTVLIHQAVHIYVEKQNERVKKLEKLN